MKLFELKFLVLIFCNFFFISISISQQLPYWQQQVDYNINVSLNDQQHSLEGFATIEYTNNSPDTLSYIWMHLYPNAYKNDKTAFADQQLENGSTSFYFSGEKSRGYINRLRFSVDGVIALMEDDATHQEIVKLILPSPLLPGKRTTITTPFHVQLPENFSRSGHIANAYQITQWYPKPAVYDQKGWHAMPYLNQGEFYSEWGNYEVSIAVPDKYIVAATGVEKKVTTVNGIKTLVFEQAKVHDFAWFADKDFLIKEDTLKLQTKIVKLYAYHLPGRKDAWANSMKYMKQALLTKSEWLGEYPYEVVKVVEKPGKNYGGMEYPTITLVSPQSEEKRFDLLINHEIGHNWFYGALASNERQHPWMDEGMNSYYDKVYENLFYKSHETPEAKSNFINQRVPEQWEDLILRTSIAERKDQPIETTAGAFSALNYYTIAYEKTAQWMKLLQAEMGNEAFKTMMKLYYEKWKFKHPYPEDFQRLAEQVHGRELQAFTLLSKKGPLVVPEKKTFKVMSFFSFKTVTQRYLFVAPAVGFNMYDKFMLGAIFHNYTLPQPAFRFLITPLFATGSKRLTGTGTLNYRVFPGKREDRFDLGISGSTFTMNQFRDSQNVNHQLEFTKLVPSLKYTFAANDPRSSVTKFLQWKSFFISERSFLFNLDTNTQQYAVTYPLTKRSLHQLNYNVSNSRVLYPYHFNAQAEAGEGFAKLHFTGNYFFNYVKGGGLNVRVFAGKFFYTGKNAASNFQTTRYHYNMTGANGYEDYTYSNYFIERNAFDGFFSQQIMIKDGGFKVRTDLLSNKYGRSDDWLTAANFSSTIPKSIFPLPVKLFADIGTYAEAWDKGSATGKFVFDGGIQISLLKNVINFYLPLVYSKAYRDYFKSFIPDKKFRKNISFSIDIQNINLKTLFPQSPF